MDSQKLCHRAELFRSKIIEEFQLLDTISEGVQAPVHDSSEFGDPKLLGKILVESPQQLIKFRMYSREGQPAVERPDRRLIRLKNRSKLPLGYYANRIVKNDKFQIFMLCIIIINSIGIGVHLEIANIDTKVAHGFKTALSVFDHVSIAIFVFEMALKWMDDFQVFWKSGWNIFDFILTLWSLVPEIISWVSLDHSSKLYHIAEQMKVFRILRSFKVISRFGSLKIIVLTLLQTFKTLAFIMLLLFTVAYVFAIVAIVLFESYSKSDRTDLVYKSSFKNLPLSLGTLFQLFTLDHWIDIYKDVSKVVNPTLTLVFILLWVWIGAFLFRNIFVGIMVNNFTSISEYLVEQSQNLGRNLEMKRKKENLREKIVQQEGKLRRKEESYSKIFPSNQKYELSGKPDLDESDLQKQISAHALEDEIDSNEWAKTVHENLSTLSSYSHETLWPSDTLFRYYQLMEELQENINEYEVLEKLAATALLKLHDIESKE